MRTPARLLIFCGEGTGIVNVTLKNDYAKRRKEKTFEKTAKPEQTWLAIKDESGSRH